MACYDDSFVESWVLQEVLVVFVSCYMLKPWLVYPTS
jgi:hypothetical protein